MDGLCKAALHGIQTSNSFFLWPNKNILITITTRILYIEELKLYYLVLVFLLLLLPSDCYLKIECKKLYFF